jgi:hypothetical protein
MRTYLTVSVPLHIYYPMIFKMITTVAVTVAVLAAQKPDPQFLAEAQRNANKDVTMNPAQSLASDDSTFFEYEVDSTCDGPVTTLRRASVAQPPQRPPQTEAEPITHDYDYG